ISLGYLLQNSIQLSSIVIIGRLGAPELSIAASGFMIATCTGWLLAVGGTTALEDVLGSKSFTKADEDITMIGVYLHRCLCVMAALYTPVATLWCFCGPILEFCGQSHELAYGTQGFLRLLAPFGLGYIYFEALKKFLQVQNIRAPGTLILLFVAIANIPLCWAVVHKFGFGFVGGVLVTGSMYWLACLLAAAYICFIDGHEAWVRPSKKMLAGLYEFTSTALTGLIMVGAEWWAFELIAVAAGVMGGVPIAAQSILMTVDTIFTVIPFGIGVAASNRIGNLLGMHKIRGARVAAHATSAIAIIFGCINMSIIFFGRKMFSELFSDDEEVISLAVDVFPWGAAFQVVDGLQAVNSGCLRAIGRGDIGAMVNIAAYYAVAIPLGLLVGFKLNWGLHGLWLGLAVALSIVGIGEFLIVNVVQWNRFTAYELGKVDETNNECEQ
ncbi:putative multidrug resistance pump, partial [Pyrenochaeta sp. MPI-SDFR-AT-0127]